MLVDDIWEALEEVEDPEVGVDIVNLGLVYDVSITESGYPHVLMSLTSPACPLQDEIKASIREQIGEKATIEFTFTPLWLPAMMTDFGKEQFMALGGYLPTY